jgi:hypothetical protein
MIPSPICSQLVERQRERLPNAVLSGHYEVDRIPLDVFMFKVGDGGSLEGALFNYLAAGWFFDAMDHELAGLLILHLGSPKYPRAPVIRGRQKGGRDVARPDRLTSSGPGRPVQRLRRSYSLMVTSSWAIRRRNSVSSDVSPPFAKAAASR